MKVSEYSQLFSLLIFILTGIVIGILFDVFRIIRKSFKTPDFVTYIEDILFWILSGSILLFSIFAFNYGEIRIYIFIGLIFGLVIYLLTLSKYFIKINVIILNFIKKILYYPIQIMNKFIGKPLYHLFDKIATKGRKLTKIVMKKTKNNKLSNIYDKIDE